MRRLMEQYCVRKQLRGSNIDSVRFVFDGRRVHPDYTPLQLNLEDGDEIDAFLEQIGGFRPWWS
ncbi:unnamed protein product [Linum tenue]|uniref:Ubiquitin-like domain-containing protein n=1 Tax=Linum tenue TaxID=586396 RepID=A0AAV0H0B6_9ROSI|nr:unnamed protein product [Linum tenue]